MPQDSGDSCMIQFREKVSDIIPELPEYRQKDWYLVKWLEEYNYDLKKAETAFRKAIKWSRDFNLPSVLHEDFSDFRKSCPYNQDAITRDGLPVLLVPFGKWDVRSIVENGDQARFLRYVFQMTEKNVLFLRERVQNTNEAVQHVIIIFDLKGYSFTQLMHRPTIQTLSEWTKRSEEQYPRQLRSFYVINAPRILPILFNLLKPVMSAHTVASVKIFGPNEVQWQRVLAQEIDESYLGVEYGGTRKSIFTPA